MDRFKLYKKWFWIGIVAGFLNPIVGLVYGLALLAEPEHRKEGIIIVIWTIVWAFISYYLGLWLVKQGYLPTYRVETPSKLFQILR